MAETKSDLERAMEVVGVAAPFVFEAVRRAFARDEIADDAHANVPTVREIVGATSKVEQAAKDRGL